LHGTLCNLGNLLSHTRRARQLVNHLDANERGVHVQHHETLRASIHAFPLQRHVKRRVHRNCQQRPLEVLTISRRRQAGHDLDGRQVPLGQSGDLLDVGTLGRQRRSNGVNVAGAKCARDGGDDVTRSLDASCLSCRIHGRDHGFEIQIHVQLLGGEQELLENVARSRQAHQQAQGELPLHDDLLDVVKGRALFRQNPGEGGGDAGAIRPRHGHQDAIDVALGCHPSSLA